MRTGHVASIICPTEDRDMRATDRPTNLIETCSHKVRHFHGSYTAYKTCGCRCDDCRKAHSRYQADYKARRDKARRDAHPLSERLEPRSPEWLRVMRAGLKQAVEESIERHGRVSV